jgi:cyclopropane fatty-acyl-phospholipid synthase-like methyltransferase
MLEALLISCALILMQWWSTPLSYAGILVMRGAAPFVGTPRRTIVAMLLLARIQPGESVTDLGCGDGRLVFAAAKQGANATGYELSVPAYGIAKLRSLFHPRCSIRFGNLWHQDYRNADVLFCYFLKDTMHDFETRIWPTLKPGCRVVSHSFTMQDVQATGSQGDAVMYVKR